MISFLGSIGRGIFSTPVEAKEEFLKTEIALKYEFQPKEEYPMVWFAQTEIGDLEPFMLDVVQHFLNYVVGAKIKGIWNPNEKDTLILSGTGCSFSSDDLFKIKGISAEQKEMIFRIIEKYNNMEQIVMSTSEKHVKKVVKPWAPKLMKGEQIDFFWEREEVSLRFDVVRDKIILSSGFLDKPLEEEVEIPYFFEQIEKQILSLIKRIGYR